MMPASARVLVAGSGFAGLWAALGAARRLDDLGVDSVDVTAVSPKPFHDIRVRNYERDLGPSRIPLSRLLDPVGVGHVTAEVVAVDPAAATVRTADGATLGYDRLVLAVGSRVAKPDIPGLAEFGFDVDTYDAALRLQDHLRSLQRGDAASATVVVVGAGLTGIETASELPARVADALGPGVTPRVVLVDRSPHVGSDMGGVRSSRKHCATTRLRRSPGRASPRSVSAASRCRRVRSSKRPPWSGVPVCAPTR